LGIFYAHSHTQCAQHTINFSVDYSFWIDQLPQQTARRWLSDGDVLFAGSIGRTDFPRGNHAHLVHAIETKLWPLGDGVQLRR
jgi:hypothetical protein